MRKLAIVVPAAVFSMAAFSQDLLQCVDPDVANGLLFNASADMVQAMTAGLPRQMAGYRPPAGFDVVGTSVRGGGLSTTVAFKTALPSEDALAALVESLRVDGWEIENEPRPASTFNVVGDPASGTVCRNGERRALRVEDKEGVRYASITSYADQPVRACHTEDARFAPVGRSMFEGLRSRMPTLNFPDTARAVGAIGGMSGSGETVSTSSRIQSPDSAIRLSDHLGAQLAAQGWSRDAAWNGRVTSGSTWTRQEDDGERYWGTLEIVNVSRDNYQVGFMLMTRPR